MKTFPFLAFIMLFGLSSSLASAPLLDAGASHVCAVIGGNDVKCWGTNSSAQLGNGSAGGQRPHADMVNNLLGNIKGVAAGASHSCALKNDGTVWCWGKNDSAQLGSGGLMTPYTGTPVQVTIDANDNSLTSVTDITVGSSHTCALLQTGGVKCWGLSLAGRLGNNSQLNPGNFPVDVRVDSNGTPLTGVRSISAGADFTCAVLQGGTVKCWGVNSYSQLGTLGSNTLVAQDVVRDAQGTLLSNIVAVTTGDEHACAQTQLGAVWCWGRNHVYQAGKTAPNPVVFPTLVTMSGLAVELVAGTGHTCARQANGQVECWGGNAWGQLGTGISSAPSLPIMATAVPPLRSITAGGDTTCGQKLTEDTTICWGKHSSGQLGNGTLMKPNVAVETVKQAGTAFFNGSSISKISVSKGYGHTCAIDNTQRLFCWGSNILGQIGDGTTAHKPTPVLVSLLSGVEDVYTGSDFTCAIANPNKSIYCWGHNNFGQLGNGLKDKGTLVPTLVKNPDNNQPFTGMFTVTGGTSHVCTIDGFKKIWCWGANTGGQLGRGNFDNTYAAIPQRINESQISIVNPTAISGGSGSTCVIADPNKSLYCWGANQAMPISSPNQVPGFTNVTSLAVGGGHTCVVGFNGQQGLFCFGSNSDGQLGNGTVGGSNYQPSLVPGSTNVISVVAGYSDTCAVSPVAGQGVLNCWGNNGDGQIGPNGGNGTASPVFAGLTEIIAYNTGARHTCAAGKKEGVAGVYCWGFNYAGGLGSGSTGVYATSAEEPSVRGSIFAPTLVSKPLDLMRSDLIFADGFELLP